MREFILKKRSIWFHILVTYFTIGIWAIVYFYFKYSTKSRAIESTKLNQSTKNIEHKISEFKISGVTFENRQSLLKQCAPNQAITIKWDKDNQYSKTGHALAIYTYLNNNLEHIGYVPNQYVDEIFKQYETDFTNNESFKLNGKIKKITGGTFDKPTMGCIVTI